MISAVMKKTLAKSATLLAVASMAGTVGALAAAVPAQASSNDCSFTRDTVALLRTDGTMLVPTVQAGGKSVGPDAVLFDHQNGPFTEFDKTRGTASGSIPADGAKFDIFYNPPSGGQEHYVGFITTTGGGTGWILGSKPQISFTVPDGQLSCSTTPNGGGPSTTATVLKPTDIYSAPGGSGEPYQEANGNAKFKPKGQVKLVAPDLCRKDNWCHVVGAPQVQGDAWIYIGDGLGSYP